MTKQLMSLGMEGVAIEPSLAAYSRALNRLHPRFQFQVGVLNLPLTELKLERNFDLGCAFTVIEHVTDDASFLKELKMRVRRGGWVVITVPAGENKWTIEDDLVGHLRRYGNGSLAAVMQSAGLAKNLQVTVIGFPFMNLTEFIRNKVLKLRAEDSTSSLTSERTKSSGVWTTKWFNTFPRIFGLLINEVTLRPVHWIGRLFRSSPRGVLLLAIAQVD